MASLSWTGTNDFIAQLVQEGYGVDNDPEEEIVDAMV